MAQPGSASQEVRQPVVGHPAPTLSRIVYRLSFGDQVANRRQVRLSCGEDCNALLALRGMRRPGVTGGICVKAEIPQALLPLEVFVVESPLRSISGCHQFPGRPRV